MHNCEVEDLIWSVVGYVRVRLCGENIRSFLDQCLKKGIPLKNVLCLKGEYRADVLSTNLKKILPIAKKCDIEIRVEGRFGLAMKLFIYRNRLTFFIALITLFVAFCVNSFFIKDIIITGNNYLTNEQISTLLRECNIYQGKFIPTISPDGVQTLMRKKCNTLSWAWVDIKGTTARVDVREKISRPDFFNKNYACNIVAERDGVITEAISESGILYAKSGTYVHKGELLIGGVYDSNDYAPVRFVHAKGRIYAKTSYTLSGNFPMSFTSYKLSDKNKTSLGIFTPKQKFEFFSPKSDIAMTKISSKEKYFKLFGKFSFPLGFTNNKYCEIIKTECKLDKLSATDNAIDELSARLSSQLPSDATVVNTFSEVNDSPDGTISVTVTFECVEDIAAELPIVLSE